MKLPERPDLSRLPWPRAARLAPLLAWGLALAVTAWVAADLFWRFNAPRVPALPVATQAAPQAAAQAIASRHLMGRSADTGQAAGAPAASSRFVAHAVVTGAEGRPGWAILSIDGGAQQGFVEGQEIRPGVTLARVAGDGVELTVGGARQRVALAERGAPAAAPARAAVKAAPAVAKAQASGAALPTPPQLPRAKAAGTAATASATDADWETF